MKAKKRHRFARSGQQPHHRYGMMRIEYARLNPHALTIGWSCNIGFGQFSVGCNYTATRNEGIGIGEPNAYTFTPAPGLNMDAECMGPEFVGEVMKALFWALERGEVIPEAINHAGHKECDAGAGLAN